MSEVDSGYRLKAPLREGEHIEIIGGRPTRVSYDTDGNRITGGPGESVTSEDFVRLSMVHAPTWFLEVVAPVSPDATEILASRVQ